MLMIAWLWNIFALTFGPLSGLVKVSGRMHPIMFDFLFAAQGLPSSDKGGG